MKDALANELMEFVNGKVFIHGMLLAGYIWLSNIDHGKQTWDLWIENAQMETFYFQNDLLVFQWCESHTLLRKDLKNVINGPRSPPASPITKLPASFKLLRKLF